MTDTEAIVRYSTDNNTMVIWETFFMAVVIIALAIIKAGNK